MAQSIQRSFFNYKVRKAFLWRRRLYNKLSVGNMLRGIHSLTPQIMPESEYLPEGFVEAKQKIFHMGNYFRKKDAIADIFKSKISEIKSGDINKIDREFVWLPYIPGKITVVRENGRDVLTGPMSGCWIVRLTINGMRYVGHIGTSETNASRLTLQVKESWHRAIDSGDVALLNGFNPIGKELPSKVFTIDRSLRKEFYALVSRNHYSTLLLGSKANRNDDVKLCGVYKMPQLSVLNL